MNKPKFKIKNVKLAFVLLLIIAFVIFLLYYYFVLADLVNRNQFANQMIGLSEENESPVFSIQKIQIYSSANAIDNSENQSLQDMSICQFSDLSIFIDNSLSSTELTDENTIKELYIDNISITSQNDKGHKILNYKNPLNSGEYVDIEEPSNNRIDFKVIHTNQENESNDYDQPTFYTDCSNPITLGYLNKDIITNYSVSADSSTVTFNGKVLNESGVVAQDINSTLNFTIHIVNNLNQSFAYNMTLDLNFDDTNDGIYTVGYSYKGKTTSGSEYHFFKEF